MADKESKKTVTLDDLAVMVAKGFEDTATKKDVTRLESSADKLDGRLDKLDQRMEGLASSVNNYLSYQMSVI